MVHRRHRIRHGAAVAIVAALLPLAACGAKDRSPARRAIPAAPAAAPVVVASFDFPESTVLAELYAEALEHAGIPVRREFDLGTRELVQPAMLQGLADLVPEYSGAALAVTEPEATVSLSDPAAVHAELARVLPSRGLVALAAAPAQNQDGIVVTRETAARYGLHTVSDLARVASTLSIGGRPECPTRPYCLVGLRERYGATFQRFVPLTTEQERAQAVRDGTVDAVVLFTTDAALASNDLVLLTDDRHLQPAENVVPILSAAAAARYGDRLTTALDGVSAQLTTAGLAFLNWRVGVAGKSPAGEAHGWLVRHGLVPRT